MAAATVKTIPYQKNHKVNIVIDGGGSAITTGIKFDVELPECTITAARVFADVSGAIAIAVWKDTYANFPPIAADLMDTFAIAASGVQSEETGLSIAVTEGDILRINVNSCTSITKATLALTVTL